LPGPAQVFYNIRLFAVAQRRLLKGSFLSGKKSLRYLTVFPYEL